jgi:hypothetical protein
MICDNLRGLIEIYINNSGMSDKIDVASKVEQLTNDMQALKSNVEQGLEPFLHQVVKM